MAEELTHPRIDDYAAFKLNVQATHLEDFHEAY